MFDGQPVMEVQNIMTKTVFKFCHRTKQAENELEEAALAEKIVPGSVWQTPVRTVMKAVHCGWAEQIAVTVA